MNTREKRLSLLMEEIAVGGVYLYGAGKRGEVALRSIRNLGKGDLIKGFVDDYPMSDQKDGITVYSTGELIKSELKSSRFIITTYSVNAMVRRLAGLGVPVDNIYYIAELLITDYSEDDWISEADQIERVKSLLSDDLSKWIYVKTFEIYKTGNVATLSRTVGDRQYFPIIGSRDYVSGYSLDAHECFLDCGAYNGDTIKEFIDISRGRFDKIYAFEADDKNYKSLSEYALSDERIKPVKAAVYSKKANCFFQRARIHHLT